MNSTNLSSKFARIGARLKVTPQRPRRFQTTSGPLVLDVRSDDEGEFFEVRHPAATDPEVSVLDVQGGDRHLLLLVRENDEKRKFLCGHDERHWFVAAIPESAPVGTVLQAKEALKPAEVRSAQGRKKLGSREGNRRKNAAYWRQGEWFFLPEPGFVVDEKLVRRNEPLRRGNGGKPHWTEFCYRTGGEAVYVCSRHPNGITPAQYQRLLVHTPKAKSWNWQLFRRNPGVYVRGRVRHADHKTIVLDGWHKVVMNTENQAKAMRNVAFLD
ncbi:hypothetical protein [Singulisphaera sp. PoT]|uniref:hypothetical protein n=1 Tax=Singulisphaera sp. PoT TaxID=3411797 RepID=UPI003BF4DD34